MIPKSSPARGRWRRAAVTEGEDKGAFVMKAVPDLPFNHSADAERFPRLAGEDFAIENSSGSGIMSGPDSFGR